MSPASDTNLLSCSPAIFCSYPFNVSNIHIQLFYFYIYTITCEHSLHVGPHLEDKELEFNQFDQFPKSHNEKKSCQNIIKTGD